MSEDTQVQNLLDDVEDLDIDIIIDVDAWTLDDLEMLSVMGEGSQEEQESIPGYQIIRFIKRVGGEELGKRPRADLLPIIKAISLQIQEIQDPEDSRGKN